MSRAVGCFRGGGLRSPFRDSALSRHCLSTPRGSRVYAGPRSAGRASLLRAALLQHPPRTGRWGGETNEDGQDARLALVADSRGGGPGTESCGGGVEGGGGGERKRG
jgi:hypothetical protein